MSRRNEDELERPTSPAISNATFHGHQEQQTRPSLARLSSTSAAHHSSPSIMTMSKMYQEQKQQREQAHAPSSTYLSPAAAQRRPPTNVRQYISKTGSSKNLEKRVLSSKPENDYFSKSTHERSSHDSPPGGSSSGSGDGISPTPTTRLPSFQSFSSIKDDLGKSDAVLKSKSLSSSKIYDRRMKQLHEDLEDEGVDFADEPLEDTETSEKYKEKLSGMTSQRGKAEFFHGEDSDDESDVDINSIDEEQEKNKKGITPVKKVRMQTNDKDEVVMHSMEKVPSSDEANKGFKFPNIFKGKSNEDDDNNSISSNDQPKKRNFLHRVAFGEEGEFEEIGAEDNLFSRIVHMGGKVQVPKTTTTPDEESDIGLTPSRTSSHQNLEVDFSREAKALIDSHHYATSHMSSKSKETNASSEATLTASSYFLAPNPDWQDETNAYEEELDGGGDGYISPPEKVRGGVLSSLLRLYQNPNDATRSRLHSPVDASPLMSGSQTPVEEKRHAPFDTASLSEKLRAFGTQKLDNASFTSHKRSESLTDMRKKTGHTTGTNLPSFNRRPQRPKSRKKGTSALLKTKRDQAKAKITVHIADVLHRQRFILRMCKALMLYGAPTHRLEEYLTMTSRVLEIDGQFIYLPGCMVVSFGDPTTRTSEVQLVKCAQGLNLYKLHRVHRIYKQVIHDLVSVDEASVSLEEVLTQKPTFSPWMCVLIYGFSSAMVSPFAFGGTWVNLPVSFGTGCLVGILQYVIGPRSQLYVNVFEVGASIVVSFVGRALGSIPNSGICFSSVVQGSLALILPGWIILCGALELQSRNLVAGSVRMFYGIVYSLFLGYGITLGSALYGWIDNNATSDTTCAESLSDWWRFLFVPGFTIGLALVNQARLFQLPVIIVIAGCGHAVSYFASKHFYNSTQLTSAMGSFVIGVLGNLYSRIFKGLAFSAMLPAVFVLIPSGIASAGSLLSGIQSANQIVDNTTISSAEQAYDAMSVGVTLINVCIGITVGLFLSAIVVYPLGKRSTSIFTL